MTDRVPVWIAVFYAVLVLLAVCDLARLIGPGR
jgi:hypothetical protein